MSSNPSFQNYQACLKVGELLSLQQPRPVRTTRRCSSSFTRYANCGSSRGYRGLGRRPRSDRLRPELALERRGGFQLDEAVALLGEATR